MPEQNDYCGLCRESLEAQIKVNKSAISTLDKQTGRAAAEHKRFVPWVMFIALVLINIGVFGAGFGWLRSDISNIQDKNAEFKDKITASLNDLKLEIRGLGR